MINVFFYSASMYSREDTVSWLLGKKADPDLVGGPMQQTCTHLASSRHSSQSSQVLNNLIYPLNDFSSFALQSRE